MTELPIAPAVRNVALARNQFDPRSALRSELFALIDALADPTASRADILQRARTAQQLNRDASLGDALLLLLLRNLLTDLRNGLPERTYFARQLTLVADRL